MYEVTLPYESVDKEVGLLLWCLTYCEDEFEFRRALIPRNPVSTDEVTIFRFHSKDDAVRFKLIWR